MDKKTYVKGAEEMIRNQSLLESMKSECENDSLSNVIAKFQRSLNTQLDARVIMELSKWVVEKETSESESEEVLTIIYRTKRGDGEIEVSDVKNQNLIKHQLNSGNRFIKFSQCETNYDFKNKFEETVSCEEIWLNVDHIIELQFSY
ncbi:hypothetical protein CAX48_14270 [Listeria monocytogenes]|uniref:hypothetical protein n=1 Tax=Listeria monocytogenes TaxID=1639 RepID=UPI0010D17731|nr:hypothetical protein [Listeria monocytogenes]EAD7214040.1 hypothetical protein [Listeria monocytogenes]EAE1303758.1 hypothetical protein [Listeria monocytogenes]EAG8561598.1 hypothetical protein [Listeria monocytogenes]